MTAPPASPHPAVGYGSSIGAEAARAVAAAAIATARQHGWTVAVAVVDTAGDLVVFERIDDTQAAGVEVSQAKARTAVRYKRPTKVFEDGLAGGRHAILGLPGVIPLEGGLPLIVDGKIIGAVGVSGVTAQQDGVCAQAGADALAAR
jgi:glc operon protein GlcG